VLSPQTIQGLSVEPCGTLDSRSMTSDFWHLAVTENVHPDRWLWNHCRQDDETCGTPCSS